MMAPVVPKVRAGKALTGSLALVDGKEYSHLATAAEPRTPVKKVTWVV